MLIVFIELKNMFLFGFLVSSLSTFITIIFPSTVGVVQACQTGLSRKAKLRIVYKAAGHIKKQICSITNQSRMKFHI